MELVLNNGFCNLSMDEMNLVNAGGWREFGYALGGTLLIAVHQLWLRHLGADGSQQVECLAPE